MDQGDVRAERAAIDRAIDGATVCDLYARNAAHHAQQPALIWRDAGGSWHDSSWRAHREEIADVAVGLADLAVEPGDVVAIMAGNHLQHRVAEGAVLHAGAAVVSLDTGLAPERIAAIAADCGVKVAILDGLEVLARWDDLRAELPRLAQVVLLEEGHDHRYLDWASTWDELVRRGRRRRAAAPNAFDARWAEVRPDDAATILYPSAVPGPPRGATLTHRAVRWLLESARRALEPRTGGTGVSLQSPAHLRERIWNHYPALRDARATVLHPDATAVREALVIARPNAVVGAPGVWQDLLTGVDATIATEPDPRRRRLAARSIAVGREVAGLRREGLRMPPSLRVRHAVLDRVAGSPLRSALGLERCELLLSGPERTPVDVLAHLEGLGLPITEVFGTPATAGAISASTPGRQRSGTVGRPLPGVEVRRAADGEVLVRGGHVMAGYWGDAGATAEVLDRDGWLRTGHAGGIDHDGFLRITRRRRTTRDA
jgi:long-chain acyl-CoA synthetase